MTLVYHGSSVKFNKFSYDFIGKNGTTEGIGFYFTNKHDIANHYALQDRESGFIYEINFTGKKSLSAEKKTLTKSQLKLLLKNIPDYLSNYGDIESDGFNSLLNQAVKNEHESSDSDVDIICGILHGGANYKTTLETLNRLLGYDSIIINGAWGAEEHIIYIALIDSAYEIKNIIQVFKNEK